MTFDPRDWLAIADHLLTIPAPEQQSRFRTAVNRAYYAPLILLKRRIEDVKGKGTVPESGVHGKIRSSLRKTRSQHLRKVEKKLEGLQEERESADYALYRVPYHLRDVQDTVAKGERLVAEIDSVPDSLLKNLRFD